MAGISNSTLNFGGYSSSTIEDCGCPNKNGFNGNERQEREFSDGSGLNNYDFNARTYDQQVGRFLQIDPLILEVKQESLSTYQFGWNNPIRFKDPDGKCPCFAIPFIITGLKALAAGAAAFVITKTVTENVNPEDLNVNLSASGNANAFIPFSAQVAKSKFEKSLNTTSNSNNANAKFDGQSDTDNKTPKEALRNAKDQNGIPRSQQPDKTIKPNTPEGDKAGLDNRNVKQYEYTNSEGKKVVIRQDKAAKYPDGGSQPPHFNAGQGPKLDQHHNYMPWDVRRYL